MTLSKNSLTTALKAEIGGVLLVGHRQVALRGGVFVLWYWWCYPMKNQPTCAYICKRALP